MTYFQAEHIFNVIDVIIKVFHGSDDVEVDWAEPTGQMLRVEVVVHPVQTFALRTVQDELDKLRRGGDGSSIGWADGRRMSFRWIYENVWNSTFRTNTLFV